MAALSYLWVLSVVMYIVKKDDAFVQFHAKQGIVLCVASFAMMVLGFLLMMVPVVGWLLGMVLWAAIAVLSLVGFIKAFQGEKFNLPVVADLAKKITF